MAVGRGAWSATALVLAAATAPAAARADEPRAFRLDYQVLGAAADACPDERSFRALVVARLGRDPFVASAAESVRVVLRPTANETRGQLVVTSGSGKPSRKELTDPTGCEAVAEALATSTALAIDPVAVAAPRPPLDPTPAPTTNAPLEDAPAPPPASLPVPEAAVARMPPDTRTAPRDEGEPVAPFARAAFVSTFALSPGVMLGAEAAVGLRRGLVSIAIEGRGESQPSTAEERGGALLAASLFTAAIAPCAVVSWFSGCLVFRGGILQGRAESVSRPELGSSFFTAVGPRVAARLKLSPLIGLTAAAELHVPLVRTSLVVDGAEAWLAPALGGGLSLGLHIGR